MERGGGAGFTLSASSPHLFRWLLIVSVLIREEKILIFKHCWWVDVDPVIFSHAPRWPFWSTRRSDLEPSPPSRQRFEEQSTKYEMVNGVHVGAQHRPCWELPQCDRHSDSPGEKTTILGTKNFQLSFFITLHFRDNFHLKLLLCLMTFHF